LRLLLDTLALLWWLAGGDSLTREAREVIRAPESLVVVSAASAWEISIKKALGKLDAPDDLGAQIVRHQFTPLAITVAHGLAAGGLPRHHHDPFDRMLIAQASAEDLTIVTRDPRLALYGVSTLAA
jgi:PIN domain nuclease of toxin-antitoxin system